MAFKRFTLKKTTSINSNNRRATPRNHNYTPLCFALLIVKQSAWIGRHSQRQVLPFIENCWSVNLFIARTMLRPFSVILSCSSSMDTGCVCLCVPVCVIGVKSACINLLRLLFVGCALRVSVCVYGVASCLGRGNQLVLLWLLPGGIHQSQSKA